MYVQTSALSCTSEARVAGLVPAVCIRIPALPDKTILKGLGCIQIRCPGISLWVDCTGDDFVRQEVVSDRRLV
jgi:hypothetical protein